MLKRLHIKNFTVFADADFEFGPGLNVLVGTNGTGKSHVLKLGYAVLKALHRGSLGSGKFQAALNLLFDSQLNLVFVSEGIHNLVRYGAELATVKVALEDGSLIDFSIDEKKSEVVRSTVDAKNTEAIEPVFIPAKEVMTLSWLLPMYNSRHIPVDETYPELLRLLSILPLKSMTPEASQTLGYIGDILGGSIVGGEEGKFYLKSFAGRKIEMNLVAEGIRKFAIVDKLLRNGSLTKKSTLFWDEPEANLNPALLRQLAAILAELARQGFQIILATHSTDLLKEFHILSRQKDAKPLPIKYFGLNAEPGEATRIVTTDNFELLPDVVALAAELKQADELEEIFIREDREYYANNRGEQPGI